MCPILRREYRKKYREKNKEKQKLYMEEYTQENKQTKALYDAQYRINNIIEIKKKKKRYREKNKNSINEKLRKYKQENKEKYRILDKKYRENNKEKIKEWREKNKLALNIRARISQAIRHSKNSKNGKFNDIVGCSLDFLKQYIAEQFKPGMSWDNYGVGGWHIDHIKPCASFDLNDLEQRKICFHYTNLQPLWAHDNLSKGSKILNTIPLQDSP
jgi:hypothetical protein